MALLVAQLDELATTMASHLFSASRLYKVFLQEHFHVQSCTYNKAQAAYPPAGLPKAVNSGKI
jgi:hypothetical protein